LSRDDYFVIADFASYVAMQGRNAREYLDPALWTRKAILNVARVSRFSSDRTVREYAREIWGLQTA
jgi:glycogen phosphorylase